MESMKFYFDLRDIFRATRLAFSGKKIWVFLKANLFGYAVYWVFSYLAFIVSGNNLMDSIHNFGLYPCIYAIDSTSFFSHIIYWIGVVFWILAIFFACTGVSRITYKQLKGNEFYSAGDAQKFVSKHRIPIFMSWISILLIALFFIVGAMLFALIGKIPFVGEIIFALLYIAYFFGAIFTIYTLIVFLVSIIYSPAIVGTMEEDTMGTVFQSYSITWSQPWRIIAYHLILLPIMLIGVQIFKLVWISGYKFINTIFGMDWLMGEKLRNVVGWATDLVNPGITLFKNAKSTIEFGGNEKLHSLLSLQEGASLSATEYIAGTILAIVLFTLLISILSYGLSVLSVGETIILTILKKKSNNENILERSDEDDVDKDENSNYNDNIDEEENE